MHSIMTFIQIVFFAFIYALTLWVIDHIMHQYYCRRAKRLRKAICRCWDCKDKCSLYESRGMKNDN